MAPGTLRLFGVTVAVPQEQAGAPGNSSAEQLCPQLAGEAATAATQGTHHACKENDMHTMERPALVDPPGLATLGKSPLDQDRTNWTLPLPSQPNPREPRRGAEAPGRMLLEHSALEPQPPRHCTDSRVLPDLQRAALFFSNPYTGLQAATKARSSQESPVSAFPQLRRGEARMQVTTPQFTSFVELQIPSNRVPLSVTPPQGCGPENSLCWRESFQEGINSVIFPHPGDKQFVEHQVTPAEKGPHQHKLLHQSEGTWSIHGLPELTPPHKYPVEHLQVHQKFKGVRMRKGRWVAEIMCPKRKTRIWLGTHGSAIEAARVYDRAARKLYGHNAQLNLV